MASTPSLVEGMLSGLDSYASVLGYIRTLTDHLIQLRAQIDSAAHKFPAIQGVSDELEACQRGLQGFTRVFRSEWAGILEGMAAKDHLGTQFSPYITPERRYAVEAAMPPVYTGNSQNEATPTLVPGNMGKRGRDGMLTQHRVARTIMKSDVPPEHLAGLTHIQVGTRLSPGTRMQYTGYIGSNAGFIQAADRFNGSAPGGRYQRDVRQRDLVHEIGHHQDPEAHDPQRSIGRVEAHAENYADTYTGGSRHNILATYDDPANNVLSLRQKVYYSRVRNTN